MRKIQEKHNSFGRVHEHALSQELATGFCRFFRRTRAEGGNDGQLRRSGDLWRLLAAITVNKVLGQVEHHRAQKRSIDADGSIIVAGESLPISPVALSREPGPDESAALTELLESFMRTLTDLERQILELRLQEHGTDDIAEQVGRSPRTVRRTLERLQATLAEQLADPA